MPTETKMFFRDTRRELLSLVPPGSCMAEIGVFDGSFSEKILEICKPQSLTLIDLWPDGDISSGDVDGNNIVTRDGRDLEASVREKFTNNPDVTVIRDFSTRITSYPENHFDAVYVDADHGYHGVLLDLRNCWRVVKDNGLIMGHDYMINMSKSQLSEGFGVKLAVDDFCFLYRQSILALGVDGCVSYSIRLDKKKFSNLQYFMRSIWIAVRNLATRVTRKFARVFKLAD